MMEIQSQVYSQGPEQKSQVVQYGQPFDLLMEGPALGGGCQGSKGDHVFLSVFFFFLRTLTIFDGCWFEEFEVYVIICVCCFCL